MSDDLWAVSATEVVAMLKAGTVTPLELIDISEQRHSDVDSSVNAMPDVFFDRAREKARILMASPVGDRPFGWLGGLPFAVKDLEDVAGQRTTFGGVPAFSHHVPTTSSKLVSELELNGGIAVGKSTSPEFGFHATTTSRLFGPTRNPHNTALTTGGSSGGAAAALASGQVWLATGSDLGASIRLPASMCGVVGLRPSPGIVSRAPTTHVYDPLPVAGPMGRTVADVGLMLEAMACTSASEPLGTASRPGSYIRAVNRPTKPTRVGFSMNLGIAPIEKRVADTVRRAVSSLTDGGVDVEQRCPDFTGVRDAFHAIRGYGHLVRMEPLIEQYGAEAFIPEILWTLDEALKIGMPQLAQAERVRGELAHSVADFFDSFDVLICPAAAMLPFPAEQTTVVNIDGMELDSYLDSIAINFAISMTACPSLSIPCALTADGLPVGIQVVGPPRAEAKVLAVGVWLEQFFNLKSIVPVTPKLGASL